MIKDNSSKVKRLVTGMFAISLILMFLPSATAADWTQTFIEGVNSYSQDGEIEFNNSAKLYDAPQSGKLPSFEVDEDQKSCVPPGGGNAKKCKSSNFTASLPSDRLSFAQCQSTSNNAIGPPDYFNPEIEVEQGEYGDVTLSGGGDKKLSFTTTDGIYKLKSLTAYSGTLELASGQYWIESLQINSGVTVLFPSSGTVSFFVRNEYTHFNSSLSYSAEQFLLYAYDDVTISGNAYFRGYLVSEGDLDLQSGAKLEGAATSDEISLNDRSWVFFSNTAASIGVVPDCGLEPVLPVVPLQCPAEQAGVAGITYRTYDTTGWKPGEYTSPVDHDDFNDLVDTVKTTTNQLGESIEARIEGYGVSINPHSSQGENYAGIFEGYLDVPETGTYTFGIDGDDAIELLIDDQVVVGFYGLHGQCGWPCSTGEIGLAEGTHKIEMRFHEATGAEAYHLYWQPPSASALVKVPESAYLTCPFPQFEFGRATLSGDGSATIQFDNTYATAPVIMLMPTIEGTNSTSDGPSTVRLVSSTQGSASIVQNEPPGNRDVANDMPEVDYFVMEQGYRFLAKGKALQAGKVETVKYQGKRLPAAGRGYDTINFAHKFGGKPAMVGQSLSRVNNRFITTVINNIDSSGGEFDIAIEASEVSGAITQPEMLGYVAGLGSGSMVINGENILYEFDSALNHNGGNSTRNLNQQCAYSTDYENSYQTQPYVVASKNARRGGDGGWIRRCRHDSFDNNVSFVVDEDQQLDADRSHLAEDIGYFAFEAQALPPVIDHYRIEFSSGAISCAAKDIVIRACANFSCTTEATDQSVVDLVKNKKLYSQVTFAGQTPPVGDPGAVEVWHADGGVAVIGLGATVPASYYRCFIDGNEVSDVSQCQLVYEDTGFYFDVPNTRSCKDTDTFELFAVTKDSQTQECKPLFRNQTKALDFTFNYKTPSSVNNEAALQLNSINAPTATVSIDGGKTESLNVRFDENGKAQLQANYPEAGVVTLKASHIHTVNTPNGTEELILEHSDDFTAAPAGFHFMNTSSNTCTSGDPYDANCEVLAKAGDNFNMDVKAVCWQSDDDTDFSNNTAVENVTDIDIAVAAKVHQPDNGVNGRFAVELVDFSLVSGTTVVSVVQQWDEVGTVQAELNADINYHGVTIGQQQSSSDIFGRFTPYYLDINGNSPELANSCGNFTYMNQPFGFKGGAEPSIQVLGMAMGGTETTNYQIGNWWRYKHNTLAEQNQWSSRSYSDKSTFSEVVDSESPALSGTINYLAPSAYIAGAQVNYQRTTTPIAPFNAKFDLILSGTDVSDEDGVCYRDSATSSDCRVYTFEDIGVGHNIEQRYGRMLLENGYGPQSESLRLPIRTEFVSAVDALTGLSTWMINSDDSCSVYNTILSNDSGESATFGLSKSLPTGFPNIDGFINPALTLQVGLIAQGVNYIYFEVPDESGEVPLKQHVEPWLKWYWDYEGNNPSGLYDPRASAFFGTYRGHDKVIFWREVN